jgi:hypothetical protein
VQFFLFNKTFNLNFDTLDFCGGSLSVGMILVLPISKYFNSSFGTFLKNSRTLKLGSKFGHSSYAHTPQG